MSIWAALQDGHDKKRYFVALIIPIILSFIVNGSMGFSKQPCVEIIARTEGQLLIHFCS